MLSRRQVVRGLVGVAVLGSSGWAASAASALQKPARVSLQGPLSKAVFVSLLGETFTVAGEADVVTVQLIQIDDGPSSATTQQFSLVFRGPHAPDLEEGLYTIAHRTAGRTALFLQDTRGDARYRYYEAPFNLLV